MEYVAGDGGPGGQNCLTSVGKSELEGQECRAAVSAGDLGQQVWCQGTGLHTQPLGQQPGLQHTGHSAALSSGRILHGCV